MGRDNDLISDQKNCGKLSHKLLSGVLYSVMVKNPLELLNGDDHSPLILPLSKKPNDNVFQAKFRSFMQTQIKPQIRQKCLQITNSIKDLRPFGLVLAINDNAEALKQPQASPLHNHVVVIDIKTQASDFSIREVAGEGAMTAVNCTAMVVAAFVTLGGAASAPVSGGSSLVLSSLGYAATGATALSCGNSALRTFNAVVFPGRNQKLVSNGEIKRLIRGGAEPKRYSSAQITAGAMKSLKDSVAAGLSFLSSSLDGNLKEVSIYVIGLES